MASAGAASQACTVTGYLQPILWVSLHVHMQRKLRMCLSVCAIVQIFLCTVHLCALNNSTWMKLLWSLSAMWYIYTLYLCTMSLGCAHISSSTSCTCLWTELPLGGNYPVVMCLLGNMFEFMDFISLSERGNTSSKYINWGRLCGPWWWKRQ